MACPDIDIYFRVDITFKALLASTEDQTKTISFIDRPYPEASAQYIAALEDLSGLGIGIGQSGMPVQSVGSVILNDLPHSLGYERRVSDLLAWYTVANQPIVIYASQGAVGSAPSFEQVWSGTGVNASKSGGAEETISIQCKGVSIPVRPVLRAIQEIECDSVTQNSIGRFPAMPIGSLDAMAEIFEDGWPCYAYPVASIVEGAGFIEGWTNWSSYFVTSYGPHVAQAGGPLAWGRCIDGKYRRVKKGSTSTVLFETNTTGSNYPTPQGGSETCVSLASHASTERYIITGGRWRFRGQNNGGITPTGNLIFRLYIGADSTGSTRPDLNHVAIATVDKATYLSSVRGASDFYIEFTFTEPFIYGGDAPGAVGYHDLHLSCTVENYATSVTDFVPGGVFFASSGNFLKRDSNGAWVDVTGTYKPLCGVYPANWAGYPYGPDDDGLYFYSVDLTQRAPATGQQLVDLRNLDIFISGYGIIDDSFGNITGTPNLSLAKPEHVLESLSYSWTGSAWASDASFDWDIYSTAYSAVAANYPRSILGTLNESQTTEGIMGVIANQCRYSVIQDTSGVITAWPAGYEAEVSAVIDSEESIVTGWEILNPETVVNSVKMFYSQNFLNSQSQTEATPEGFESYAKSLDFANLSVTSLISQSQALFGKRELGAQAFSLIGDSTTAENVGELILRQHDLPHWIVNVSIPFWKYRSLRLMDIIEITSPALPAYFGTSEEGQRPIFDGDYEEAAYGEYPKRAQQYRCQIIQKNLEYQAGTIPRWDLTVRIISPYHPNEVT